MNKSTEDVDLRVALCFPDAYEIGMSHLGMKVLYSRLNSEPRIWCERAFTPLADMERLLRERGLPLTTLESGTPLAEMDILGFSLQHELSYTNVLLMLELGGLPIRAEERGEDAPLVLVGGPAASHPEPLAPFIDAVALGDGEELALQIAASWREARREGLTRDASLARLAELPAVYVPALASLEIDETSGRLVVSGEATVLATAARIPNLADYPFPTDTPVALTEAVFDRAMSEISRGCGCGCRFCQAGMIYRPVRERSPEDILSCLLGQVSQGGFDEASLTSLSSADYSQIGPLIKDVAEQLGDRNVALSVSSLRAHGLDREVSEALARVRTSSLTLAPEAATQRLRDVINKNITEEEIISGARAAITRSRRRIKLYFMIGLPTETEDDVRAIAELARRIRDAIAGRSKRRASITVSASTFIPKPHTPLQWCATASREEVLWKQGMLRRLLAPMRIEARFHDIRLSIVESILSRGDRRAGDLLEAAYEAGARFDGWDDLFNERAWNHAFEQWELDPGSWLTELPLGARLPWDHLATGPSASYLAREHRRALSARTTPPCLRHDGGAELVCNHCGLDCDLEQETSKLERQRVEAESMSERAGERREQGDEESRFRLIFAKRGALAMLGHLDTVRLFSRLLRRAGLRLAYSRGFHPKPKLSLAVPLPLGMAGLAEVMDFGLVDPPPPELVLERLVALAPAGLTPKSLRALAPGEPGAAKAVTGAEILLSSPELTDDAERLVAEILARPHLLVERKKKKESDVRAALLELEVVRDATRYADLEIPTPAIRARIVLGHGATIRPEELASWMGIDPMGVRAHRIALLTGEAPKPLS